MLAGEEIGRWLAVELGYSGVTDGDRAASAAGLMSHPVAAGPDDAAGCLRACQLRHVRSAGSATQVIVTVLTRRVLGQDRGQIVLLIAVASL